MSDKEVKIRYCDSATYFLGSCDVGWGMETTNPDGSVLHKTCHDEPKEQNCHYLMEEPCQKK